MKRKLESETKKPWERVSVLVGALGGVTTLVVAVTQQRPASTLAITAALLLLGGWYAGRVMTTKFNSGRHRYPRGRWVAVAASLFVLAGIGAVLTIPRSRAFLVKTVLGFPNIEISRLLVSESDAEYRISIVILNKFAREGLARTVKLRTTCPRLDDPHAVANEHYKIEQDFRISTTTEKMFGSEGVALNGEVVHDGEPGFHSRVVGSLARSDYCGWLFDLSFNMSTPLPSNQHVTIAVDLPKRLNVPEYSSDAGLKVEQPTISLPRDDTFLVTLVLADREISGSPD